MTPQAKPDLTIDPNVAQEGATSRPNSSPINLAGIDLSSIGGDFVGSEISSPTGEPSPPLSPRQVQRDPSRNLLTTFKNRLNPGQDQKSAGQDQSRRMKENGEQHRPGSSSISQVYRLRNNPGSTPELSLLGTGGTNGEKTEAGVGSHDLSIRPRPAHQPSEESIATRRKDKTFRNPLIRTKSRRDSNSKSTRSEGRTTSLDEPPNTAPLSSDWPGSETRMQQMNPRMDRRGKSAERAVHSESDDNAAVKEAKIYTKEKEKSGFGKNVVSKAKSGGGSLLTRLGKIGRSSSSHEKEIPDSEYVIKIINQPLVEQTRITRISKDLGSCRDKTEYWMPSLPWRCIDYLNLNCESEGLYRVPGSGPQVKHWQRRFDTELDVDLLDEQELYDPNNIGSMFKSWLRDLPTEIMPAKIQLALGNELEKDNPDYAKIGQPAPQKLRDTLSELPPFNYYLLFAITCHLSLLLSHKEQNKMDLNNLSICIGPCLKLERWLFNYLVGEWRHCWQGCFTEKQYLEIESAHERGERKPSVGETVSTAATSTPTLETTKSAPREIPRRPVANQSMTVPAQDDMSRSVPTEDMKPNGGLAKNGTPKSAHRRSQSDIVTSPLMGSTEFKIPTDD